MKMNRRNVLISIATVAMITGAALGSGAFTTVEADRSMDIQVSDDANAYLEMGQNASIFTTETGPNNGEILQLDLDQLNDNATTEIDPAFYIKNNMGNPVDVRIDGVSSAVSMEADGTDLTSDPGVTLNEGEKVTARLTVDTTSDNTADLGENTITIVANTSTTP